MTHRVLNRPISCVWEITMGCNMRCKHCGSSCTDPLADELSTAEAVDLAAQIGALGVRWVTLSGGEPLTRPDWPDLVTALRAAGVKVTMISNGWLIDRETARTLRDTGIDTVAISVDGPAPVHDRIRKRGSFQRIEAACGALGEAGVFRGAITTVTRENIGSLADIRADLIRLGVGSWQVQIGLPMGNLAHHPAWLLDPAQMDDIVTFAEATALEGAIIVHPADCLGYFDERIDRINRITCGDGVDVGWTGCNAGLRGFGILHNGDILGCTSIRDRRYIEGNIRTRPLADLWADPSAFSWRRSLRPGQLQGDCGICPHVDPCLGGCANTRLTMAGSLTAENPFCLKNVALKRDRAARRACA